MVEICTKMFKHLCNVVWSPWDGAFGMADEDGGSCFYKGGLEGLQLSVKHLKISVGKQLVACSRVLKKKGRKTYWSVNIFRIDWFWPPTCGHEKGSDREDKFADTNGQNEVPQNSGWKDLGGSSEKSYCSLVSKRTIGGGLGNRSRCTRNTSPYRHSGHVHLGKRPGIGPGEIGREITNLPWPRSASESSRRSCSVAGERKSC